MSNKEKLHTSDEEGAKVYQNPILHQLSKNHIAFPLVIFYGAGIALTAYGILSLGLSTAYSLVIFVIGMLLFSLIEYLVHRFLYHLPTVYEEGHIPFALHGIHHKYPKDKKRLVMPPVLSVTISSLILGLNYLFMGTTAFPFTAGFLFGYSAYLTVHFVVHRMKPPKNFLKELWIHHSIHHYQDDTKAYGVSSPLWDYVFGTMPEKRKSR